MKKRGILNAELMRCIASLGHKDLFMIGDAGMPIPEGVKVIDLAVCSGVPLFNQVFDAVVDETEIEYYYIAEETAVKNQNWENISDKDFRESNRKACLMRSLRRNPRSAGLQFELENFRHMPM